MKNRVYVLNEGRDPSKRLAVSVIYFSKDTVFPIQDDLGKKIDKLREISDVAFIFAENLLRQVDPKAFGTLYRADLVAIDTEDSESLSVGWIMTYLKEIIGGYTGYAFLPKFAETKVEDLKYIPNVTVFANSKSIFKTIRLTDTELSKVYMVPQAELSQTQKIIKFFKDLHSGENVDEEKGIWATHTTIDDIIFLRSSTIDLISSVKESYSKTFKDLSFGTYLSSLMFTQEVPDYFNEKLQSMTLTDVTETIRRK